VKESISAFREVNNQKRRLKVKKCRMNEKIDLSFDQLRYSVKTAFYDVFEKSS
jgi:hypothetical protein